MADRHGTEPAADVVRRTRFTTSDIDEGIEVLRDQYTDVRPRIERSHDGFTLRLDSRAVAAPTGRWDIVRLSLGLEIDVVVEPMPAAVFTIPLSGAARYRRGRDEADAGVLLAPIDSGVEVGWSDLECITCTLDLPGVQRLGAELSGLDPAAIMFSSMTPITPALGQHLATLTAVVKRTLLDDEDALASPLVRDHAFRTLAGGLLAAFPNSAHRDEPRPREDAEPATVRRAVDFIDANSDQPVGLTEIAAAARTSARGLQRAFARYRDTTPLGHLRRVRLERARADLRTADPAAGDTVAAVATRWGFHHHSRFAAEYRHRFGETPATTLRH